MQESTDRELNERLNLIESMIAEGRQKTGSWGWSFVLWGVAYYVAMALSSWAHLSWAWPVTVLVAFVITGIVASHMQRDQPETRLGRSVGAVWMALGISVFLLFLVLSLSGKLTDAHLFIAVLSAFLGMANGASALMLRWKAQFCCAAVWWAAAVAGCFGSTTQCWIVFLAAIFLGQIVFGTYVMVTDAQSRRRRALAHV